jgi:hypothetical protein
VPAPSERSAGRRGRRHKRPADRARQAPLRVARRLPGRRIAAVADSGCFAAIALPRDPAPRPAVVTRLRLDARLCEPPPPRRPRTRGRPPVRGARLPGLAERPADPATPRRRVAIDGRHGRAERRLDLASGTALWHHPGMRVPIRRVLVRDPSGEKGPQAFLCTGPRAGPVDVLRRFVRRRRTGTTFEEARRHLGMQSQRRWSDPAVLRTTPAPLGLFSLVTLRAGHLAPERGPAPERVRWHPKPPPTFADALARVRRELWAAQAFAISPDDRTSRKIPADPLDRLLLAACRPP